MTEGLKSEALFLKSIFLRKSLRVVLRQPTSLYKGGCFPQKDGRRVRVSPNKFIYTKKAQRKNPCAFSGAEGETRRVFNPSCSLCEQFILCPFLLRKKMDEEFESPALFALYRKKVPGKSRYLFWRRRRDSNSRAGYPTYALSRGASSPT